MPDDRSARANVRSLLRPAPILVGGIAVIVAITFAVIVATLNRGFDWGDEGFVFTMIASKRVSDGEFWGFHYLLHPIYQLLGESVLAFRVLRLLGYLVLSGILVVIARAILRDLGISVSRTGWIAIALVAQIGTFAAWSYPPRYLGYNELSSWFAQLAGALMVLLLVQGRTGRAGEPSRRRWLPWILWGAIGALTAALVVAKITSGIVLVLLVVVVVLLPSTQAPRWIRALSVAAGGVAALLLMLVTGTPLGAYAGTVVELLTNPSAQGESGYSLTGLMSTYLTSLAVTSATLAVPTLLAAVILFVVRHAGGPDAVASVATSIERVALVLAALLAVLQVAITAVPGALPEWDSLGSNITFLLMVGLLGFALLSRRGPVPAGAVVRTVAAILLFVATPLVGAVGTNNPIFGQTLFSATIWAVGGSVVLVIVAERSIAEVALVRALPLLMLATAVGATGLTVAGDVFLHPYHSVGYFSQKTAVSSGDLRGVQLTADQAELWEWLQQQGDELDAHDVPALSAASPGALLPFNASTWTSQWPGPAWSSLIARSCDEGAPEQLFVLQSEASEEGTEAFERLVTGLDACGIDFPADFDAVAEHPSSTPEYDVTIWSLR